MQAPTLSSSQIASVAQSRVTDGRVGHVFGRPFRDLFFVHAQPGVETPYLFSAMVGMARRAVPARVVAGGRNTRATLAIEGVARLRAARTSQRDVPTTLNRYETPGYYQMSLRDNPALEPFRSKADLRLRRRLEFSIRPAKDRHLADAGSYQINRAVFSGECSVPSN